MAACTRACSASSAARSPSSSHAAVAHRASAPRLSARAAASWSREPTSCCSTAAIWSRSRRMRSAASCSSSSRSASWTAWSSRRVAQPAHAVGDLAVLVRDAVEELGALEQVAEAVGLEHHGERVGRVRLVDLDEAGGQHARAPLPARCAARSRRSRASSSLSRTSSSSLPLPVEARLHAREPPLGRADLALDRVDPGVEPLDRGAEDALLRLVLLDLRALLLDARRQRRRQPGQRQHQDRRDGKGIGSRKLFFITAGAPPGSPRLPRVMQGISALATAAL